MQALEHELCSTALKDTNPGEPVDLEDAFLATTEELNFDFPEPSPVDRIKAGLMEATIGSLLFVGLLVALCCLAHIGDRR